jgi:hypothetical protein
MKLLVLSTVFILLASACSHRKSCCQDKCAKPVKHDKEHHHVTGKGDHMHDEDHHQTHDHKAHHPDHEDAKHGHDKNHQHVDGTPDHAHDETHHEEQKIKKEKKKN